MRSTSVLLAIAMFLMTGGLHAASADDSGSVVYGGDDGQAISDGEFGDECCDQCGGAGRRGRGSSRRNRAANFNCNCNGSYKFPVPPLYTYHWPGMYSHQLMTNYHSPWRFPGIRPYRDEKSVQATKKPNELRQASYVSSRLTSPVVIGEPEPISAKMRRYYQQ